ncbi:MAG: SDR family oxidoreductase [Nitriliruptorales bacterium]|nr:SDR family oxidoreductase [Nitriliruptorales bacterium]
MTYFVTGATGFIGRFLVERLLEREGTIYCLVRESSQGKLDQLRERLGDHEGRIVGVVGDLTDPYLGVSQDRIDELQGEIDHVFHLAAIYDLETDAEWQRIVNVEGTRHACEFAEAVDAGIFHHTSSIAAAGRYEGTFREHMFGEATGLEHPYFRTKHLSEKVVRTECETPWRIYRPGIVVGHSETGEIDKIDGPYFFFPAIEQLSNIPSEVPLVGIEGGKVHLVPVDFVVDAMDHIAHEPDLDGQTFHLVDPDPPSVGEVLNAFCAAAGAPGFPIRIDVRAKDVIPTPLRNIVTSLSPVHRTYNAALRKLGIPREAMAYVTNPTRFDTTKTRRALAGSGIEVPPLTEYADVIYQYWKDNLRDQHQRGGFRRKKVEEKVVLITGASSGIGLASAKRLAREGATVLLVARSVEDLKTVQKEIAEEGGTAYVHPADLSDLDDCQRLISEVLSDHGRVDVLVNNAGISIRRSVELSYDRFHDFERTMQLNYFGALRLVLGFLPGMRERGYGHIVNVSSIGVQTHVPRFSAYIASKAALDTACSSIATEVIDQGVTVTTIYMPLVRTPMIEPTKIYRFFPAKTPEQAADMVFTAIKDQPKRISSTLGTIGEVGHAIAPKVMDALMNYGFHLFPESSAARGDDAEREELRWAPERRAFSYLLRGIHF